MKATLDTPLNLRIKEEDKTLFVEKCGHYGVAYQDMLREMVAAFNAGAIRIIVPETQLRILKGIHTHEH